MRWSRCWVGTPARLKTPVTALDTQTLAEIRPPSRSRRAAGTRRRGGAGRPAPHLATEPAPVPPATHAWQRRGVAKAGAGEQAGAYPQGKNKGQWRGVFFYISKVFNHVCFSPWDLQDSVKPQAEKQFSVLGKSRLLIMDVNVHLEPVP